MAGRNDKGTDFDAGTVQSVANGTAWDRLKALGQYVMRGVPPDAWFGPNQPLQPAAQDKAKGRAFDYATGHNLRQNPRQGEGNPFDVMRGLADSCTILRLVIETRKDQLCRLDYRVAPREGATVSDAAAKAAEAFLASPDKEHTWDAWLRMLLEDMLVIDAPVVYPRPTKGGGLYALELIDGATINRLIDETGRTPLPPDPAYQQVLKGLPAVDYTADELIYMPRNPRTNRVYGFSPVEQVVMIVNIALRRDVHKLQYYTEGSLPDFVFGVPESWQPDHIKQFQEIWDSLMAGNTANRRKGMFIPFGVKPIDTKEAALKDEFDEWLARVICFCFSIPPQPFVKEVNRATAKTAQEAATQEGLHPLMRWVKGLMDLILAKYMGQPDLEFQWKVAEDVDPLVQAQVHAIYIDKNVLDVNEVREALGLKPLTDAELEARKPAPPALPPGAGDEPKPPKPGADEDDEGDDAEKLAKVATAKALTAARKSLAAQLATWLADEGAAIADEVQAAYEAHLSKAAFEEGMAALLLEAINWSRWDALIILIQPSLEDIGQASALRAFSMLDPRAEEEEEAKPALEAAAKKYGDRRAAELVGKKRNALGELVDNPNARWAITDTTREALRAQIDRIMAEGTDPRALAQAIRESAQFGKPRAELIARTELNMANNALALESYYQARAMGIRVLKVWTTANDDRVDPECVANGAAGPLELEAPFPSGDQAPPCHPRCRCAIAPKRIKED